MKTTIDFLDDLRVELRLTSDYQVAKALGVRPQHLSRYRTGKHTFDEQMAIRVAGLLKLDSGYVLACVQAERAKNEVVRKAWSRAAKALAGATVALLVGCTVIAAGPGAFDISPTFAHYAAEVADSPVKYTLCASRAAWALLFKTGLCAAFLAWMFRTCSGRLR